MAATPPPPPPSPGFCTVVPGRRPETKLHTTLAHAKNAIGTRSYNRYDDTHAHDGQRAWCPPVRGGQVFQWVDGAWKLLHDVPARSPRCELPWKTA